MPVEIRFWHAIQCDAPAQLLNKLYHQDQDGFDGTGESSANLHKIFTHLLKMTPKEYIETKLREELLEDPPPPPGPITGEHTYLPVPMEFISWDGGRHPGR